MVEKDKGTPETDEGRIHPVVKATGWVSFFTDLGSELIYPLLPEFLTVTLKVPKYMFGLIEGVAEGTPAIVKYFAGAISDRVRNRKWLIFAGYALSSLVKPFIGLTKYAAIALAPFLVLALRILDKIGKGVRGAPRDAVVADFSEGKQGKSFGYQRAMDHAGAVAGGLVAFVLLRLAGLPIEWAIVLSIIPGVLSLFVIGFFVHDRPDRAVGVGRKEAGATVGKPALPRAYYVYLVSAVLFTLANSSDGFLLIRAREMRLDIMYIPLVWAVLHVVKTITAYIGGTLSDRIGRKPVLFFGWLLYAVVYAGFSFLDGPAAVWALFPIYGIFYGATEGVAKAFVADLIPSGSRGRAFGILGMVEGLLLIPTSIVVGLLWDRMGTGQVALAAEAGLALLAAIWLIIFVRAPGQSPAKTE
ncbi:MAG TPA: MFS transporter [Planctomycetes bacterium]|nr:MFS transporter [Planctomycetota bacterium]